MDNNKCWISLYIGGIMSLISFACMCLLGIVIYTIAIDFIAEGIISVYI